MFKVLFLYFLMKLIIRYDKHFLKNVELSNILDKLSVLKNNLADYVTNNFLSFKFLKNAV